MGDTTRDAITNGINHRIEVAKCTCLWLVSSPRNLHNVTKLHPCVEFIMIKVWPTAQPPQPWPIPNAQATVSTDGILFLFPSAGKSCGQQRLVGPRTKSTSRVRVLSSSAEFSSSSFVPLGFIFIFSTAGMPGFCYLYVTHMLSLLLVHVSSPIHSFATTRAR